NFRLETAHHEGRTAIAFVDHDLRLGNSVRRAERQKVEKLTGQWIDLVFCSVVPSRKSRREHPKAFQGASWKWRIGELENLLHPREIRFEAVNLGGFRLEKSTLEVTVKPGTNVLFEQLVNLPFSPWIDALEKTPDPRFKSCIP